MTAPPPLAVRRAGPGDLPTLVRFGAALARQHAAYDPRRFVLPPALEAAQSAFFAEQLASPDALLLVAQAADAAPVGYAFARREPASFVDALPVSGWVHDLYVEPAGRGRGAGAALLDAAIAALHGMGVGVVLLTVAPANEGARRVFARRGFAVTMHEMALAAEGPPAGPGARATVVHATDARDAEVQAMGDAASGGIGTIRPVVRDDSAALKGVIDATGLFPAEMLDGMLAGYLAGTAGDDSWLTIDDGGPVAVAYVAPERMTAGTWNLYLIAVHPGHQSRGRGAALLRHVEQALATRGARVLLVETSGLPEFARTRAFYRTNGYDEEARIREFYAAGEDKVVFRKALAASAPARAAPHPTVEHR